MEVAEGEQRRPAANMSAGIIPKGACLRLQGQRGLRTGQGAAGDRTEGRSSAAILGRPGLGGGQLETREVGFGQRSKSFENIEEPGLDATGHGMPTFDPFTNSPGPSLAAS